MNTRGTFYRYHLALSAKKATPKVNQYYFTNSIFLLKTQLQWKVNLRRKMRKTA